jgi:hypothetical protein
VRPSTATTIRRNPRRRRPIVTPAPGPRVFDAGNVRRQANHWHCRVGFYTVPRAQVPEVGVPPADPLAE